MDRSNIVPFGTMPDGTPVERITLSGGGFSCRVITYGGAIQGLTVPDRSGGLVDVVLGLDSLEGYLTQDKCLGALVGRYANRIGGSRFVLNGKAYPLFANNGPNHLHGGRIGFDKQVWTVEELSEDRVTLALFSPDGQEGYPGDLHVWVTYALEDGGLTISYRAQSTEDTLCSLTNHAYFNLAGHGSGSVCDHVIQLFAQRYTPSDSGSIPTGELADVEGTPMDLRLPTRVGDHIDEPFQQLVWAHGYDHNWIVDGTPGTLRPAARVYAPETGIVMETETTMPGVQLYTGNFLGGCPLGKEGVRYEDRSGLCLETQYFPDAPNKPQFPSPVLRAGEEYRHRTVYRFSIG